MSRKPKLQVIIYENFFRRNLSDFSKGNLNVILVIYFLEFIYILDFEMRDFV